MKKSTKIALAVVIVLIIAASIYYFLTKKPKTVIAKPSSLTIKDPNNIVSDLSNGLDVDVTTLGGGFSTNGAAQGSGGVYTSPADVTGANTSNAIFAATGSGTSVTDQSDLNQINTPDLGISDMSVIR